jgi:hypothetical protein
MAPTPSPTPNIAPVLANAKKSWDFTKNILTWFIKLVTTGYTYSDMIIKARQNKVNKAAKIQRAEEEARKIMEEQAKKRSGAGDSIGRRSMVDWYDFGFRD